jgi:hypothetical protein
MAIEDRGQQLLGVNGLFLALALLAVFLRTLVRTAMVKSFGGDDWLMLLAMVRSTAIQHLFVPMLRTSQVFFILYCASSITGVRYGTGRHHRDLDPVNVVSAMKCWWLCYLSYSMSMICSKVSIGLFFLRITVNRVHNWILYVSMTLAVVTAVVFFFVTLFQCRPIQFFWERAIPGQEGTCLSPAIIIGLAYLYSSINVFVDFAFALLPAFLLYGLQLDKRTKVFLIPLLGMGCMYVIQRFPRSAITDHLTAPALPSSFDWVIS